MTRRVNYRAIWFRSLAVFTAVFLFTVLINVRKQDDINADAASLAKFNPGYIISDFQMKHYNSMTEAEIQKFLTSKNNCSNKDEALYKRLSANNPNIKWHFEKGHFICLSEELFGDGEVIGKGETAAHIIWQAAQDYKINPQVLIVLLQKETGLITDKIPNNFDYRKATGYGCPDTAPCSEKYYGFKNQVRKAAALFSEVVSGGWTNYPLGKNYIQYNPSASCGGSVVEIKNLATSALYRYTPYQPNAGALAAGYGTAACGAYGNRNFYLYFQDWFGGILDEGVKAGKAEAAIEAREKGAKVLGRAKTNVKKINENNYYKEFENGYIYWTEKTGAWDISGGILAEWKRVQKDFGYPTSSEIVDKSGTVHQTFENGSIYWDSKTGTWVIRGFAEKKWVELGGVKSKLGKPTNDGVCGLVNNGCYQGFENGNIYWTEKTGSFDVSGGIYYKYHQTGTEWGTLGYPTSSEIVDKSGTVHQTFENGSIYWDSKTGTRVDKK